MPELASTDATPFSFANPRQNRIHTRLARIGPGPANFYLDACKLASEEPRLASASHLIAHALREVESAILAVLRPAAATPQGTVQPPTEDKETRKNQIRAALTGLKIANSHPLALAWLQLTGSTNPDALHKRAHRDRLAAPRPFDEKFQAFLDEFDDIVDFVLQKLEENHLLWHAFIDALAQKQTPSSSDARLLRNQVPNNLIVLGYFFDPLANPAWLRPLAEEGLFDSPPEPEPDTDDGKRGVRLWAWPQSRYLARVASVAPAEVRRIIQSIPATKNTRVHLDFAEAALAMPADVAALLVPNAAQWIEGTFGLLLPRKLGDLTEYLARNGQVGPALQLARTVLRVKPDPDLLVTIREPQMTFPWRGGIPEFDLWEYGEILTRNIPSLVDAAGAETLELLGDLLVEAIQYSHHPHEKRRYEDHSSTWRIAVEDHQQNADSSLKPLLVAAIRDSAERVVRQNPETLPAVIRLLRKRRHRIFLRIAHHLLRVFAQHAPEAVRRTLLQRGLFFRMEQWHEYALLLRTGFSLLTPAEQATVLGWIEQGPDVKVYANRYEACFGRPTTPEQISGYVAEWQIDRLALLADDLPEHWHGRYAKMIELTGPPEHPDFGSWTSGGTFGHVSPRTIEDLEQLSTDELVALLSEWKSEGGWGAASPEGLGRQLTSLVEENSSRFAEVAPRFCGLDPTYIRALIGGLEQAVKRNQPFPWQPVLLLCQWVTEQQREIPGRNAEIWERDPNWDWTQTEISRLFSCALESEASGIPFEYRDDVWRVLEALTKNPEPTQQSETEYLGANGDPSTHSLNSPRGQAMHAVIRYALWVRRQPRQHEQTGSSFESMPEVAKLLQDHLDPTVDASLAIRSVYGQWLPSLTLLDSAWATRSLPKIFPENTDLRDAAWRSYLALNGPWDSVFAVLRDEYVKAVERLDPEPEKFGHFGDPSARLAEHLFILYGRGRIQLSDPLLQLLFAKASDLALGHALSTTGLGVSKEGAAVPAAVLERFKKLWDQRIETAANRPADYKLQLVAFGRWFVIERFDKTWSLERLERVLALTRRVDIDHLVAQRLAALSPEAPHPCIRCLALLAESDSEGHRIAGWREQAGTVLSSALNSADPDAKEAAVVLINRLDARGYPQFSELLNQAATHR